MTDTVFLVYLARDGLFVVAEYTRELGFWCTRVIPSSLLGLTRVYIPSGPRLFDADGGGFRDDFFRLPMVSKKKGDAESGGVQEWKPRLLVSLCLGGRCFDHHREWATRKCRRATDVQP